jgi:hypothetical protein
MQHDADATGSLHCLSHATCNVSATRPSDKENDMELV